MKTKLTIILAIASIGLFHDNAIAEGPYSFSVDWFKVCRDMHGCAVDRFNDEVLSPWRTEDESTAYESGGMVTLTGPGNLCSGTGIRWNNFLICEEKSEIMLEDPPFAVADGEGNFWAISTWEAIEPAQNQGYGMNCDLEAPIGVDLELITIGILKLGPIVADIFGHQEGLYVVFERDVGGLHPENTQLFRIEEDITGNIRLILWFNDSTDQFTGHFSLDDGDTFQSPFLPIESRISEGEFADWEFADWELNGRSISIEAIVALDIKPQSCPNPINVKDKGMLPAAILGTAYFDVTKVDVASIKLVGVAPLSSAMEDVATPPFESFDCIDYGSDGFTDLTLKFNTQEVVEAIEDVLEREVVDGEALVLTATGDLLGEFGGTSTSFQVEDVVVINKKGKE